MPVLCLTEAFFPHLTVYHNFMKTCHCNSTKSTIFWKVAATHMLWTAWFDIGTALKEWQRPSSLKILHQQYLLITLTLILSKDHCTISPWWFEKVFLFMLPKCCDSTNSWKVYAYFSRTLKLRDWAQTVSTLTFSSTCAFTPSGCDANNKS